MGFDGDDFEAQAEAFEDTDQAPLALGRPTLPHALLVFAGGTLGTLLRYLLIRSEDSASPSVDWCLLGINVSGSLILGVLVASIFHSPTRHASARLFLASGVLGGWTTYSAIISSTLLLGHAHHWGAAASTVVLQTILPVGFACLGLWAGRRLRGWVR